MSSKVETYHNHSIYITFGELVIGELVICPEEYYYPVTFDVRKNGKRIFTLLCLIRFKTLMELGKVVPLKFAMVTFNQIDKQQAQQILCEEGLKQVCERIDLGRFEEGGEYIYQIEFREANGLSAKEIR